MFNNILVCSDGSEDAHYAVQSAALLAKRFGSRVLLLNVFRPAFQEADGLGVWSLAVPPKAIAQASQTEHAFVVDAARPVFEAAGLAYQALQEHGHPVGAIVEVAKRENADLIVIGSRGLSGIKSFFSGSVSSGVLQHAPCSVLITHGEERPLGVNWFERILLASDASEGALRATQAAFTLAAQFRSVLALLNVLEMPGMLGEVAAYGEYYPEEYGERVLQAIEASRKIASEPSGIASTLRQETGHPAETILRVAEETEANLIVVGSRGLGGFQSLLLGSVSHRVATHAHCPVLLVRGNAAPELAPGLHHVLLASDG